MVKDQSNSATSSTIISHEEADGRVQDANRASTSTPVPQTSLKNDISKETPVKTSDDLEKGALARTHSVSGSSERARSEAVDAVTPRAEYEGTPEEEQEVEREKQDPFLVVFDENDPMDPKTWSRPYRWFLTFASSVLVLNASFASSAPSGIAPIVMRLFDLSQIEGTLTISLFIAGYCVGPLFWGPMSEQYGRRPMNIIGFAVYTVLQVACAVSPNGTTLLVFRFLSGCFAACLLTNSGAIVADIWDAETRGTAMAIFTLAPFAGPALGPICGGYIALSGISWRWVYWVLTIFAGFCEILIVFAIPETYAPILLVQKAAKLRKETGDQRYSAALERVNLRWQARIRSILGRPFKVLFLEPMLMVLTLYMSYSYGILYLLFLAYPVIFVQGHGLNSGQSGLTFLPIFLGGAIGVGLYIWIFAPMYAKESRAAAPKPAPPEARLPMAAWGGPLLVISMFWLGWTSFPSISIWAPVSAGFGIGVALTLLFLALINYLVDAYLNVAASALASSTVVRSLFGAGFPLFGNQMYQALNPRIASTVLACATILLVPVPFILQRYGPRLRKNSRYAVAS